METRGTVSKLDTLFHRLAVVNARLHEGRSEEKTLLRERGEIMELITRERLGQAQQFVWKPGDGFMA